MLRSEIQQVITSQEQQKEALELVDAIEDELSSGSPKPSAIKALISALPTVGNIAAIGSFLLSIFTKT